jgi:excisionase family DNA binding protein
MVNLLSLEETAKELRLSIHTLRAWVYQKRIPVVKLGRRVLVKREDMEAFVNENVVKAN